MVGEAVHQSLVLACALGYGEQVRALAGRGAGAAHRRQAGAALTRVPACPSGTAPDSGHGEPQRSPTHDAMTPLRPSHLGDPIHASPLRFFVQADLLVPSDTQWPHGQPPSDMLLFEKAGPRRQLFFDPKRTRAAIVTCGGLCPGLNNVIRSVTRELKRGYGVSSVLGIRGGYRGLDPSRGKPAVELSDEMVEDIHQEGGTLLGTSRGPVDMKIAVDFLVAQRVNVLFTVGGDGTQRGGHALFEESPRPGPCVVGGRHPQDHRQRRALRDAHLRLCHGSGGGGARHPERPHRGAQRATTASRWSS